MTMWPGCRRTRDGTSTSMATTRSGCPALSGGHCTTFPDFTEVQKEFRDTAGTQQIHPPAGVVPATQGAAIDFWLRTLIDPQPSIALPLIGLLTGRAPCIPAGKELLDELAVGIRPRKLPDGEIEWRLRPADFADRGDEWWARLCYALALLVELYWNGRAVLEQVLSDQTRAAVPHLGIDRL
ncbi:hypothetical protein [Micromonospora ureilytica]|uniref:hypothetical protein n=1 Tax=Micromonospora ureilytica TaxID=709868 RepID=UPI0040394544